MYQEYDAITIFRSNFDLTLTFFGYWSVTHEFSIANSFQKS